MAKRTQENINYIWISIEKIETLEAVLILFKKFIKGYFYK